MTTTIQEATLTDSHIETEREILRQCLDKIAEELGKRLQGANLNYPIYLTVPNSGEALMLMATPLDPPIDDWSHITKIVQSVVSNKLGGVGLRNRTMACATTSTTMSAVDLTAE